LNVLGALLGKDVNEEEAVSVDLFLCLVRLVALSSSNLSLPLCSNASCVPLSAVLGTYSFGRKPAD